ncbi:hypothetical protein [Halobacteriovorax marinus]|uniref:hypothetical protein n=1 Tax=Halobacteriovorax marinus TaxID=97084 RepID=UPI003A918F40
MKKLITICALAASFTTFADCTNSFNKGVTQYNLGASYFQDGMNHYQRAVDESRGQGRRSIICEALLKSNTGFDVATRSFLSCTTAFGEAASSCSGTTGQIARDNQQTCAENHSVSEDNYTAILETLKATCFGEEGNTLINTVVRSL